MSRLSRGARGLASHLPPRIRAAIRHAATPAFTSVDATYSFSQEGEDVLLSRLFEGQVGGFYVDVGAHHPTRFSNTHLLYLKGWTGINIDAMPGSMELFVQERPRDTNLELAISQTSGVVTLQMFDEPALNTLSAERRRYLEDSTEYVSTGEVDVPAATLASVLSRHLPAGTPIDLLTIDVEGHDFDVLQSNDWERFRPRVLLIEILDPRFDELGTRPEIQFLSSHGYRVTAKLFNTVCLSDDHV